MKLNKIDILLIFGFVLILLVGVFAILYYFNNQAEQCISQPFIFGASKLKQQYGFEVHGKIMFLTSKKSPILLFNSTSLNVQK